jgi:protein SCO1/2
MMAFKTRLHFNFSIAVLLAMLVSLIACDKLPVSYNSIDITGSDAYRDFQLTDSTGKQRSLKEFRGKYVLVFFGFTQCPAICPTALARAAAVKQQLGKDGERLQVIFISIDPERDTSELIAEYTKAFDPSFIGLRGSLQDTKQVADEFKVFYAKVKTGSDYTMDHSTLSYLFDPNGNIRLAMRHEHTAEKYVSDIRQLMTSP